MSCAVHEEDLSALVDGELDAVTERRLREHLAMCGACRRRLTVYRRLTGTLAVAAGGEFPASPAFLDRVVAAARASNGSPVRRARPVRRPFSLRSLESPLAAAAAVLLLLGLAAGFLTREARVPAAAPAAPPASPALAEYLERAAAIPPGDAGAHEVLARWCLESGLPEMAGREYLKALGADPGREDARRALADLLPALPDGGRELLAAREFPDLGPPLPERVAARPPTRGERLTALGLDRIGDRWLSPAARRLTREHRDEERLLAAVADRKTAVLAEASHSRANPVAEFLASLAPADGIAAGRLTVVPLRDGDGDAGVRVLGAREALEAGILVVTEDVTDGRLAAQNRDPARHVFLAAGEVLVGGQQDRLLIRDVLLPPSTTDRLPVVCCERERWTGPTVRFETSAGIAPPAVRRLLLGARDQSAIWNRIAAELVRLDAVNETQALRAVFAEGRGPGRIAELARAIAPALEDRRTVGFLVFADGKLLGGETFADHDVFRALGPRYLEAYALDAAARSGPAAAVTPPPVRALLDGVARAAFYRSPGAGSGEETEFVGRDGGLSGRALVPVAGARPLHVTLFPPDEEEGAAGRGDVPPPPADEPAPSEAGSNPLPPTGPERGPAEERGRDRRRGNGLTPEDLKPKRDPLPPPARPRDPPPPVARPQDPLPPVARPPAPPNDRPGRVPGREDPPAVR